jgi:hypothetical protein
MNAPSCDDCIHLQGKAQCGRPVPSYWNPATNQRRSRVAASIEIERSTRKVIGNLRERCGPNAQFFMARWPAVPAQQHDTIADSDGDDGA